MTKPPYKHSSSPFIEIKEKVRYSETDQMKIAHNKSYFEWFEIARTEYCRRKNIPYKEIEDKGYYLVVVEACCRYKKALRYDEEFIIRVSLQSINPKKAVFQYEVRNLNGKTLHATGHTIHIVTNAKAEVTLLPEEMIKRLRGEKSQKEEKSHDQ